MQYLLFITGLIFLLYMIAKGSTNKPSYTLENVKGYIKINNPSNLYEELSNRFGESILEAISKYGMTVPFSAVLAVIRQESSSLYKTKSNSQVIGDNGTSFGYMQVSKYALADFNYRFATFYQLDDLKNEKINIEVGTGYLDICYNSALRAGASNPVKLAFKKYNGGNDETETSLNLMASNYSASVLNHYTNFNKLFV